MWTNIGKPTGANYTNVNVYAPSYDETTIVYDDASVFYDGVSQSAYTNVPKPNDIINRTISVGMITGVIIPLTYATSHTVSQTPWVNINKPT